MLNGKMVKGKMVKGEMVKRFIENHVETCTVLVFNA